MMANLVQIDVKQKQVLELLKLEELFHSHYLTEELLNGMITLYVKFVQNIHQNQHPIRIFFMEKIKFVLSRPEVLAMLEKRSQQQNKNMRETIRGVVGVSEQEELEIKRMAEETKQEVRRNHFINHKKERNYDKTERGEQMRERERNIKIEMQVQIMQQLEQNMLKMKKQNHHNNTQLQQIHTIVQKQDLALNERLARRRNRLRKKSLHNNEKEAQLELLPIPKQELLEMKNEVNQTYERFTRLTMNKAKRTTQAGSENEGRVKLKVQSGPIQEEDIFDQLEKEKKARLQQPKSFLKKKKTENSQTQATYTKRQQNNANSALQCKAEAKIQVKAGDSSMESKQVEQSKGRVTVRQKDYQQIQEEPF